MKHFRLTGRLLAPLAIQQDRQSHAPASLDYLPGSSLRGALAAHWRRLGGRVEDPAFRILFLENPVKFPNLLPTDDRTVIPAVLPLTAMACKGTRGFRTQDGHGVEDSLVLNLAGRLLSDFNLGPAWDCPECGQERKPYAGFWNGAVDGPREYSATMTYQRHTGIDRVTGVAAEAIFYTTQAVAHFRKEKDRDEYHPQYLSGGVWLDDEQEGYLQSLCNSGSVFVGADRTRGLGELTLELTEAAKPIFDRQAWDAWDQGFKAKYQRLTGQDLPDGRYFSLKLASSAILVDKFLCPTAALPLAFPGLVSQPVVEVAKNLVVRGWQSSWGLPKPDDLALATGSIYLWRYDGDDPDSLVRELQRLNIEDIGLRQEEGFGRVSICELLHVRDVM